MTLSPHPTPLPFLWHELLTAAEAEPRIYTHGPFMEAVRRNDYVMAREVYERGVALLRMTEDDWANLMRAVDDA